jgi:S1-C subfamily serine protease
LAPVLVGLGLLAALAPTRASAQDKTTSTDDVRGLEARFKALAQEATPKTVCVKSYIDESSDKAGYGSGAIVSADGYVITCAHVVDIAKRCEVILADGTSFPGKILGKNRKQDYAVVKIDATGLTPFTLGDSSKIQVGDWVVALGHPGGPYEDLKPSFAAGRVRGLHRKLPISMMERFYDDAILTDVPIVFGNSGGPLVGLDGKLLGLNGAIIMINDNAFAVPINEIAADLSVLEKGEMVAGKDPTDRDMAEFQKTVDPKVMEKLFSRGFKNLGKLFGGKDGDNPLAKLFGGKDGENPFAKLFGGKDGENPLGKLFGEGGDQDLGKLFGKLFKQRPDGEKGEDGEDDSPMGGIDLGKMLKQFQDMMGGKGEDGQGPDMGKLLKGLQKMFAQPGEGDDGDDDEAPKPPQTKPAEPAPSIDRGGYLGVKAAHAEGARDGVLVDDVLKDGPAAKAGVQKGDVIVALGSALTPDTAALQAAVRSQTPGSQTTITVDRTRVLEATLIHERVELKVTIAPRDPQGGK